MLKTLIYHYINDQSLKHTLKPFLQSHFAGKKGLEIGGASAIFKDRSVLPIYSIAGQIDNCNFAGKTVWEDKLKEGYNFHCTKGKVGFQYIAEATDLSRIKSDTYDFILSSHALEHVANPIKALTEFKRVLKINGYMMLVLPHKLGGLASDQLRKPTPLNHMVQDYKSDVSEYDLAVMQEVIQIHDKLGDWTRDEYNQYITSAKDNFEHRCLHHHVFAMLNTLELVDYVGFQICYAIVYSPSDIIVLCKKAKTKNNLDFFTKQAVWRKLSPFRIDRS